MIAPEMRSHGRGAVVISQRFLTYLAGHPAAPYIVPVLKGLPLEIFIF
jgi:hypothetical protein